MAITGIDTQIMVARTTDVSRDTSIQQRRGDLAQEFANIQARETEAQVQKMVVKTAESETAWLRPDDEGTKDGGGTPREGKGKDDDEDKSDEPGVGTAVPAGNNIIDIKI